MIHDGSSAPSLTLPHSMGEGEGGGPRQARGAGRKGGILEQDVDRPTERRARLPGRSARRVQACRSGESAIVVEALVNNAG